MPELTSSLAASGPLGPLPTLASLPARAGLPLAHGGGSTTEEWTELGVVVVLAALAAAYGRGVHEMWRRRGVGAVVSRTRVAAFAGGLAMLVFAQSSVVHSLADSSFAGHMVQHMMLILVAAPLLAAGDAGLPLMVAAPVRLRRPVARARASGLGRWLRRSDIRAVGVGVGFNAVLWFWHLPQAYLAAVDSPAMHALEHISFVTLAWLLWSTVLGPARQRLGGATSLLLLFATMMSTAALGAVLTFSPEPIYPVRALPGADPLADQQLAGLIMWLPMDGVILVAFVAVVLHRLSSLDRTRPGGWDLLPPDHVADGASEVTR